MKRAFVPLPTTQDYASCGVGEQVWRVVAACKRGEPFQRDTQLVRAAFIRELCELEGAHFPAALALVRYELPAFSNAARLILLNRDDRPPPVLMDSPRTAWAVLTVGWPIRVRMRSPDGRFIKPADLESWARGELD